MTREIQIPCYEFHCPIKAILYTKVTAKEDILGLPQSIISEINIKLSELPKYDKFC